MPTRYPQFSVMVTESPPVSPSVVAAIFMIQKLRVTSGTLLRVALVASSISSILDFSSYKQTYLNSPTTMAC